MNYDPDLLKELAPVIAETAAEEAPFLCFRHPEEPAAGACSHCGRPLCAACLGESYPRLVCLECTMAERRKKILKGGFSALKMPVFWVFLCVIVSGIAYWWGMGNPSVAQMTRRDARRPWYRQEVAQLYLAQATRESQRAAVLRQQNLDSEARQWSTWAADSFRKAADYWAKTPVADALRVGEARALADCGRLPEAMELMSRIQPDNSIAPAYYYYYGEMYNQAGNRPKALEYFEKALVAGKAAGAKALDNFLEKMASNLREGGVISAVNFSCGLGLNLLDLQELLRGYDLPSLRAEREKAANLRQEFHRRPRQETRKKPVEDIQVEKLK